jgi:hypothetical protein
MHEFSAMQLQLPGASVPHCLRSRVLSGGPLPSVEVAGGSAEGHGHWQGEEEEGEERSAVARFVMSELSRELYTELMEVMRPW